MSGTPLRNAMAIDGSAVAPNDVVIEDRMTVAVESKDATRKSNAAQKVTFYSRLIVSCSEKLIFSHPERATWQKEHVLDPAHKMVEVITQQRRGRFIWLRHLPQKQYYVLTRTMAVDKLANDLICQLHKLLVTARAKSSKNLKQSAVGAPTETVENAQLKYAVQLIITVCQAAEESGMSPLAATRVLDSPPRKQRTLPVDSPQSSTSTNGESKATDNTTEPPPTAQAQKEYYEESPGERSLRLQLRHRYLAVVRTQTSIYDFSKRLLQAWGVSDDTVAASSRNKIPGTEAARSNKLYFKFQRPTQEGEASSGIHGLPPSLIIQDVTEKFEMPESQKPKPKPKPKPRSKPKMKQIWTLEEKGQFLEGMNVHGCSNWKDIATFVSSRTTQQVRSFGMYLKAKFKLEKGAYPNEEVRAYLLGLDKQD